MLDWLLTLLPNLIIPAIAIISGRVLWKRPSANIDIRMGRKSTVLMESEEMKRFTREYFGKIWWKTGWILLFITIVIHTLFLGSSEDTKGIVQIVLGTIQILSMECPVILTKRALKRNFDEDESRK